MLRSVPGWKPLAGSGAGLTLLGLAVVYPPARGMILALLIFAIPGSLGARVAFPRHAVGFIERCVYALGIGLAIVSLAGFALSALPWGLPHRQASVPHAGTGMPLHADGPPWGWWLIVFGGAAAIAGVVIGVRRSFKPRHLAIGVMWVLAGVLFVVALATATYGAVHAPAPGFTQLWIVRDGSAAPDTILIGIQSDEKQETTYTLRLLVDGQLLETLPNITLAPAEQRDLTIARPDTSQGPGIVEAQLFRTDAPTIVYRRAILRP